MADWIKHVFTCKQNNISPSIYKNYLVLFNRDLLTSLADSRFDVSALLFSYI